ncbi:urocanate hydratase, partial [Flavobacteriaceae bacterium AH-315-O20]|nr:urocanate hydratase [Flavobacteriaceae bacterium AH-315-O20]
MTFQEQILQGIPNSLPVKRTYPKDTNRAPKRKDILSIEEKQLAIRNALRYFPKEWHETLSVEFAQELKDLGRIYMYRFKPDYKFYARPMDEYPAQSSQAASIMLMIQNNLDPNVAQHPEELITYGGNGAVFQNWAQYLITMQYLATMNNE